MARGRSGQRSMLALVDIEERIPATHSLRPITTVASRVLASMRPTFDAMDAETDRPAIPPERLLLLQMHVDDGRAPLLGMAAPGHGLVVAPSGRPVPHVLP